MKGVSINPWCTNDIAQKTSILKEMCDLTSIFGKTESDLSLVFYEVMCFVFSNCVILYNFSNFPSE